jgi:hypothetical protein
MSQSPQILRPIVWAAIALLTVLFWALAIIGAVAVLDDWRKPSIWAAHEQPLPCAR